MINNLICSSTNLLHVILASSGGFPVATLWPRSNRCNRWPLIGCLTRCPWASHCTFLFKLTCILRPQSQSFELDTCPDKIARG